MNCPWHGDRAVDVDDKDVVWMAGQDEAPLTGSTMDCARRVDLGRTSHDRIAAHEPVCVGGRCGAIGLRWGAAPASFPASRDRSGGRPGNDRLADQRGHRSGRSVRWPEHGADVIARRGRDRWLAQETVVEA